MNDSADIALKNALQKSALLTNSLKKQQSGMRLAPKERKLLSKILARARARKKQIANQRKESPARRRRPILGGFRVH